MTVTLRTQPAARKGHMHCTIFLKFIKGIPLQARRNPRGCHFGRKSDDFLDFRQISKQLVKLTSVFAGWLQRAFKIQPRSPNNAILIIFSVRTAESKCFIPSYVTARLLHPAAVLTPLCSLALCHNVLGVQANKYRKFLCFAATV